MVPDPGGKRRHDVLDLLGITLPVSRRETGEGWHRDRSQTAKLPEEIQWIQMDSESAGTGGSKSQRH